MYVSPRRPYDMDLITFYEFYAMTALLLIATTIISVFIITITITITIIRYCCYY